MKTLLLVGAVASLGLGLWSAVAFFLGGLGEAAYKQTLLAATLGWFILATTWAARK